MRKGQKDRMIYTILIGLCIVVFWVFDNFYTPSSYSSPADELDKTEIPDFFIPASTTGVIVSHNHYSLSYHEAYEQAEWVVYTLKKEHLTYDARRRPDFIEDPYVRSKSADWRNYRRSGYDRGHLCPAGDRRFSELAYKETFYTSNISPQDPEFNAGIWNELEKQIRYWSKRYGTLHVVTGGVLEPGLKRIGEEGVSVPHAYYKIVGRGNSKDLTVLGFVIPNKPGDSPLQEFLVPVDRIEELTGINFFQELPDREEEEMEKKVMRETWSFRSIH